MRAFNAVPYIAATPHTSTGTTHSSASKPINPRGGARSLLLPAKESEARAGHPPGIEVPDSRPRPQIRS